MKTFNKDDLILASIPFLDEMKYRTLGEDTEIWLNNKYGPSSQFYKKISEILLYGFHNGWAANIEINGSEYRRSTIAEPSKKTNYFSITTVYQNSDNEDSILDETGARIAQGAEHGHPYGEINLVIPLDKGAQIRGFLGWRGAGWTCPAPGSWHYPEAKGGRCLQLFYLPCGRIVYKKDQPAGSVAA